MEVDLNETCLRIFETLSQKKKNLRSLGEPIRLM